MNRQSNPSGIDTDALERATGFGWGWFTLLGAALVVLSALAFLDLPPASAVSVYGAGMVMVIGALAQLATALLVPGWRGIGLLALSAIFYAAAGLCACVNPMLASTQLTLLLAFALMLSGLARLRLTVVMPPLPGWAWVAASGIVSILAGLAFVHLLYVNPVRLLGMTLAGDLGFQGAMVIAFGAALRASATRRPPPGAQA